MITNKVVLARTRESWRTVREIEAMIQKTVNTPIIFSLVPLATGFSRVPESLLLLFAVSVLEDALKQLREEKLFSSKPNLKAMMQASRAVLPWQDFAGVDGVRERRNKIAHEREFLKQGEYKPYLDALAQELLAWRVLTSDYKGECTITFSSSS
jgi:hypothetical protein